MTTKITRIETEQYSFPCECCEDDPPAPCVCPGGLDDEYFVTFVWTNVSNSCEPVIWADVVSRVDPEICDGGSPCGWCNEHQPGGGLALFLYTTACEWRIDAFGGPDVVASKVTGSTPVGEYHSNAVCDEMLAPNGFVSATVSQIGN